MIVFLQMTYVGPPMIYYGTEAGMWGADDPCDRMPMVWQEMTFKPQQTAPNGQARQPDSVAFDEQLFNFYRAAIALRREHTALRRGEIEFVAADDAAQFLGFRRANDDESLIVSLNRGEDAYRWTVSLKPGESVAQIFTASGDAGQVTIEPAEGKAIITVPPLDGIVLQVSAKE
jgi:glycosidase